MSTDMQMYSIELQSAAIAEYALGRGLKIIKTYEDSGKSGLLLENREALRRLIADVRSGRADFAHLLIYDISRWGRFQDPDESAYYEYICRQANITIHYCAERFENDGSLVTAVAKNLKRAMAAEFSRELSVKVFAGQARAAARGYFIGCRPGYGLRRFLVGEDGERKGELKAGQRKALQTDHVILVPGPAHEVETVRRIYDLFVNHGKMPSSIAATLNAEGVRNANGGAWHTNGVRTVLTHEKYIGNSIYAITSRKLGKNPRRNNPSEWVRADRAFEPIVPADLFARARQRMRCNAEAFSTANLLNFLSAIWCRNGQLTMQNVITTPGAPSPKAYEHRFGSFSNACFQVGYRRDFLEEQVKGLAVRRFIAKQIVEQIQARGGLVNSLRGYSRLLVNNEVRISVVVGREKKSSRSLPYAVEHLRGTWPDIFVIARMTREHVIKDYFIVPTLFIPCQTRMHFSGTTYKTLADFRFDSLAPLFDLCARLPLVAH